MINLPTFQVFPDQALEHSTRSSEKQRDFKCTLKKLQHVFLSFSKKENEYLNKNMDDFYH